MKQWVEIICIIALMGYLLHALDDAREAKNELQALKASCPIEQGK